MIDYGSAYFFNMMPIDVSITLNDGNKQHLRRISGSEPFDPCNRAFDRSFDERPKNLIGFNNTIIIYYSNNDNDSSTLEFQVDPDLWSIVEDIQIYLFYGLAVAKCGRKDETYLYDNNQKAHASENGTAYIFNLTSQSILLKLNPSKEGNDDRDARMIPAESEASPFTPSYASFPRVDRDYPRVAFGTNNEIKFLLACSEANVANRTIEVPIKLDEWPLKNDIQLYLLNGFSIVRTGGKGERKNYSTDGKWRL